MNPYDTQEYLGDGLYVKSEGAYLKLMTMDALHPDNIIYLDEGTFKKLVEFAKLHAEAWFREEE